MPPRKRGAATAEIFISYASKDRSGADAVCAALEADGLRCWMAPRDGTPGVAYGTFLVEAIDAARIVLVVFSRAANRADGVLNELELAFNRKRPLFAVRLDDGEPKGQAEFYLRRTHWFDAFPDLQARLPALPAAVRAALAASRKRTAPATRNVSPLPAEPASRGNIVLPETPLFGRDDDVATVVQSVHASPAVTLWGTGGVGKTRLALAAAAAIPAPPGGTWFVDLAAVRDGASVPAAIATLLGVREERQRPLLATLTDALAKREALLVLDNCEHVIDACATLVSEALRSASRSRFLCTSREPLAIAGETVVRVDPLAVPDEAHADAGSPAIQLFLDRAAAAGARVTNTREELAAIGSIVRQLEGIPFAIELAAARARSLPPAQIARALNERLRVLTSTNRTAVARQQTLRGTIDWSYQLLSEAERLVLRQVSVFAGGWTTDALAQVVHAPSLGAWEVLDAGRTLTEKSLVTLDPNTERYRLLEATREFAAELLRDDERAEARRSHAVYYAALAERTADAARAGTDTPWDDLRPERANVREALEWALAEDGDASLAAATGGALAAFWDFDGTQIEGTRLIERAIAAHPSAPPTRELARAWFGLAFLRMTMAVKEHAYEAATQAATFAVAVGDRPLEARSLLLIGHLGADIGQTDVTRNAVDRALAIFRELGDLRGAAGALSSLALVASRSGEFGRARALYKESADIAATLGVPRMLAVVELHRAELEFAAGEATQAVAIGREALIQARATRNLTLVLHALLNLATYLLDSDATTEAYGLITEALEDCAREESVFGWRTIQLIGILLIGRRRDQARRFYLAAEAGFRTLGYRPGATEQRVHDRLAAAVGNGAAPLDPAPYAAILREAHAVLQAGLTERPGEDDANLLLET